MKNHSIKKAAFLGLMVAAAVLTGCGGGGGNTADPSAAAPAAGTPAAGTPVAATPTSNSVPSTVSDSPSLFMAFVKAMAAGDETSEPLTMPDAREAGDENSEPQIVGA